METDTLWDLMRKIENLAFDIPPPNQITPEIVGYIVHARSEITRIQYLLPKEEPKTEPKQMKPVIDIDDWKIAVYEFLLKCEPKHEADYDMTSEGNPVDCSNYVLSPVNENAMAQLADDMGVSIAFGETAWEAIQRHMGNILNREEKDA